jgi:chorismate synthase
MASNSFGTIFRFTTFGESHGTALGVVVDGCPPGLPLDEEVVNAALARRSSGNSPYVSPRKESDLGTILSGVFDGVTTGAPIAILINNTDVDSSKYEPIADLMRPGHANFTYLAKYGIFDYRGGGRSSARETAARVAAGAVAALLLQVEKIRVCAWLSAVGRQNAPQTVRDEFERAASYSRKSPLFAPGESAEKRFAQEILGAKEEGDSVGGVVSFYITGLPAGLGDPVYEKLEAKLASALISIPATRGFEVGQGFSSAAMRGSEHNDRFCRKGGFDGGWRPGEAEAAVMEMARKGSCPKGHRVVDFVESAGNNSGGVLGGISTGMPVYGRVAFKPTSSINRPQSTVDKNGTPAEFRLPEGSRHDPCVAVRAVPVVEAMCALVVADCLLLHRTLGIR